MAGVSGNKRSQKFKNQNVSAFSNEILKDSDVSTSHQIHTVKPSFGLRGILGLGQSIEINKEENQTSKAEHQLFSSINHLDKEHEQLILQSQEELQKEIKQLQADIQKLAKTTDNLEKTVEMAVDSTIIEANTYEINFLQRLKTFIFDVRKNISEASAWLETFQAKRSKKRNAFWGKVKDKKHGGEAYLFSNEHSASRAA